jgi:hypothetical protein
MLAHSSDDGATWQTARAERCLNAVVACAGGRFVAVGEDGEIWIYESGEIETVIAALRSGRTLYEGGADNRGPEVVGSLSTLRRVGNRYEHVEKRWHGYHASEDNPQEVDRHEFDEHQLRRWLNENPRQLDWALRATRSG